MNAGIHRPAVSVQLRDDKGPRPRIHGPACPVRHNIAHRRGRFLKCTGRDRHASLTCHTVSGLRFYTIQGRIDTVIDNVMHRPRR